jgi:hypothetical protein
MFLLVAIKSDGEDANGGGVADAAVLEADVARGRRMTYFSFLCMPIQELVGCGRTRW